MKKNATTSLRKRLKAATRDVHRQAEDRWTEHGQFQNHADYVAWLLRMRSVHASLGAAAVQSGWPSAEGLECARARWLNADTLTGEVLAQPRLDLCSAEAWGVLYALNGSALGADLLLRQGARAAGWPVAYLQGMAEFAKSGQLKAFFEALEDAAPDFDAAYAGALQVFDMIAAKTLEPGRPPV